MTDGIFLDEDGDKIRGATHDSGEAMLRAEERKNRGQGGGGRLEGEGGRSKTTALTSRGGSSYITEGRAE